MLHARLATAAVAIPLLLLLILSAPRWLFALFVACIAIVGVAEYAAMAFRTQPGERALTTVLGALVIGGSAAGIPRLLAASVTLTIVTAFVWTLFARADFENGLRDLGLSLAGIFYVGFLLPHFIWLHRLDPAGPLWVVFVLVIGMAGDTGGYAVGRSLGRHKLMPRLSPGKTVEGAVGIVVASLVAATAAKFIILQQVGWTEILLLAGLMAVLGQLGDLSESIMKRTFGVKESGWLFPGHGGVLDRVDSLLFPVAFLYYHVSLSS